MVDSAATRQDYGDKKGEGGGSDKVRSSKPLEMIKGGGSGDGGGPTGSSRSYPKGGGVKLNSDFNPMNDSKRGATDWAVGGV